jgi:hypothetical protein
MSTEPKDSQLPEHVGAVPLDLDFQKQKEEARKKARKLRQSGATPEAVVVTKEGEAKKASELTLDEQDTEFIKCASNPIYFIETYLSVFDQTQGDGGKMVPFKLFSFQRDLVNMYMDERFVVANKYRQAGISTTTCAYIAWYVMFKENRSVAIVADKLETARDELMNDVVDFIDDCPTWLRPKPTVKDTQKLKRYDNGCQLSAFSSKGLRGYTPTLLFWDETAWTEKSDKFWTSAKPTLQTGGRAIFVSTPNGLDPVFYKTFDAARKGDSTFKAVELWWFNDPRYNDGLEWVKNKGKEKEIRMKDENWTNSHRINLMDDGWEATSPWFEDEIKGANGDMRKIAQELLCSFLGSGDNFIAEEYLKRIEEEEIIPPIRQEYTDLNMWIFEDPIPGEEYIMPIDASAGHGDDFSTVSLYKIIRSVEEKVVNKDGISKKIKEKKTKFVQVSEYYGKVTPQMLAEIAYQFGLQYNNAYAIVDITGGYGVHTVEKLIEIGYPEESVHHAEVKHKPSRDRLQGYIKKGQKIMPDGSISNVDLIPGFFIGDNRPSVLLEMQRAIHLEYVVIRSSRLLGELKTFVTVPGNRTADHKRSFHDDSIMGLAIGLYTVNYEIDKFNYSKEKQKKVLDAMLLVNDPEKMAEKKAKENNLKPDKKPDFWGTKTMNPDLQKHIANEWLFKGLNKK